MMKKDPSAGRKTRLSYLCNILNLRQDQVAKVRYQLLHRTASAIIEARRFTANNALMLVHSFSEAHAWFTDFKEFAYLYGIDTHPGRSDFSRHRRDWRQWHFPVTLPI